jgi:murein DD-endopeptidase MepM/ murein hydrolase activator NlpD
MRALFVLTTTTVFITICSIVSLTMLYAAGGLAAAQTTRMLPIVGPQVSDKIEAWVLGAEVNQVVEAMPTLPNGTPVATTPPYVGEIDDKPECGTPTGFPVSGPIRQYYRPAYNPSHTGIDISVNVNTGVRVTHCGTVTYAGWSQQANGNPGYGYLVIIANGPFSTYYAHNNQLLVAPGDFVEVGHTVALSGSTGNSTGPHVHYEVRVDGNPVNPMDPVYGNG